MVLDWAATQKLDDHYNFVKAEDFFENLDRIASGTEQVSEVSSFTFDGNSNVSAKQLVLKFDNGKELSVRFVRPQVWRIRCNHNVADMTDSEHSSTNVVQPTITDLVQVLDGYDELGWNVRLIEDNNFLILQSFVVENCHPDRVSTQLWIQRRPFQISAVQLLQAVPGWGKMPHLLRSGNDVHVALGEVHGARPSIVWQTQERGLKYQGSATVLALKKPAQARYFGFGEHGGTSLFMDAILMNFFNYDNMVYDSAYNQGGPTDPREPLYHSEPFWIEANRWPGYFSKVGTFVDNYSQICFDLGKCSAGESRIATRFGPADIYIFADRTVPDLISLYTSIVGRTWLKPRYALGYGQGAYGYDTQEKVEKAVQEYRANDFPLDTMHIDVDLQEEYRTFTVDTNKNFPQPQNMFSKLRKQGIKCSTNITPFINCEQSETYQTLNEMVKKKYYVADERHLQGTPSNPLDQRYMCYEKGELVISDPNIDRPSFKDPYVFAESFNNSSIDRKMPFHGGISYGDNLGKPGFYPDLNRREVREWWGEQYQYLIRLGLEFVWQDMTSPSMAKEYGDMKSFPSRLLMSTDHDTKKPAIEVWSLYAYNLHKATFNGWNKLPAREGKRNFIIGRGSFAGLHRYAGLWTGDNAGTWDFLSISISQALALGVSGLSIAGGDVGGFMPGKSDEKYTDPELLIRWYTACFLLPWFRNHYNGKPGQKLFQEPYKYYEYYLKHVEEIGETKAAIFEAVLPVCRYYTKLRYSFMQMLYDALFENVLTGLPIVKPMIVTETSDESLYEENQSFLSTQYIVRNDLLVAPIVSESESKKGWREIYLPSSSDWFPFNLSLEESPGRPLAPKILAGSRLKTQARIQTDSDISKLAPMFVREGAIIPMIKPQNYIPDPTTEKNLKANAITFHVYPGRNSTYDMYLDDGVSRSSAPMSCFRSQRTVDGPRGLVSDPEAMSKYRHVRVTHEVVSAKAEGEKMTRRVKIATVHDGYEHVVRDIGNKYLIVLWYESGTVGTKEVNVSAVNDQKKHKSEVHHDLDAVSIEVPVYAYHEGAEVCVEVEC